MSATAQRKDSGPGARHEALLGRAMHDQQVGGFQAISDVAACVMPLLEALEWQGPPRQLAEALPHYADTLDIVGLRGVLANLSYATRNARTRLDQVDPRLLPCLFQVEGGPTLVILGQEGGQFRVFNGKTNARDTIDGRRVSGTAYFIEPKQTDDQDRKAAAEKRVWFEEVARRFRSLIWQMVAITCLTSMLALTVPLFIMAVYDWVIPSRSIDMLVHLFVGVIFAMALDAGLRSIRARMLAYVGGRIDMILGSAAFQQILHLPSCFSRFSSS